MAINVTSFNNTPQAEEDVYDNAALAGDNLAPVLIDVMANDLGGKAKSLYSLDDGITAQDLLTRDAVGECQLSANGATIWITSDGKVGYDARTLDGSFMETLRAKQVGDYVEDHFTYAIRLGNGTLSWTTATVRIYAVDDAPEISGPVRGYAHEDGDRYTRSALDNVVDVDTDAALLQVVDIPATLPAGVSYDAGAKSFTIDPSHAAYQSLGAGQTTKVVVNYGVSDGTTTVAHSVEFIVVGTNDAPTIVAAGTDAIGAVTDGIVLADSGSIAFADVDLTDSHTASVAALGSPLGTLTLDAVTEAAGAGTVAWSYAVAADAVQYLAEGETRTDSFVVTVADGHGGSASRQVDVTITGTNDAPTIVAAGTDAIGAVTDGIVLADSGSIAFADVDLTDSHTASVAALGSPLGTLTLDAVTEAAGAGTVAWSYAVAADAVQYLAEGETRTDSFVVTVADGHGGSASRQVDVTITGTNDAPTIAVAGTDAVGAVTEDVVLADSGSIAFVDFDLTDSHTASVAALGSPLGTLTLDAVAGAAGTGTVGWSYAVAADAVDYLAEGETRTDSFVVTVADGHGGTASRQVDVTITGTNDAPVNSIPGGQFSVDANTPLTISGIGISDVDSPMVTTTLSVQHGSLAVTGGGASITGNGSGGLTINGTLAQVNAALASLVYKGNANFSGSDTLSVVTSDGLASDSDTVAITVLKTNAAPATPQFTLSAAAISATGSGLASGLVLGAFAAADPDGDGVTYAFSGVAPTGLSLNANTGVLTLSQNLTATNTIFSVVASDGDNQSAETTIRLWVGNQHDNTLIASGNTETIIAFGLNQDDTLQIIGGSGNDMLVGGNGADKLQGGGGNDILFGGTNTDRFMFVQPSDGVDTIQDFNSDRISISKSGFGGGLTGTALSAGQFVLGAAATQAHGQFIYDSSTGNLSWDVDGTGAIDAVHIATLAGQPTLTLGHFELIA